MTKYNYFKHSFIERPLGRVEWNIKEWIIHLVFRTFNNLTNYGTFYIKHFWGAIQELHIMLCKNLSDVITNRKCITFYKKWFCWFIAVDYNNSFRKHQWNTLDFLTPRRILFMRRIIAVINLHFIVATRKWMAGTGSFKINKPLIENNISILFIDYSTWKKTAYYDPINNHHLTHRGWCL